VLSRIPNPKVVGKCPERNLSSEFFLIFKTTNFELTTSTSQISGFGCRVSFTLTGAVV